MELKFGEREEKLRAEVRQFLKEALPEDRREIGLGTRDESAFQVARVFNDALAKRGWIAPAWPREYGGLGASIYEQMVFNEELGYASAPDTGTRGFGVGMIGPTLIVHASEEQKRHYLPKITSGEHIWCQGYSEPSAGSDLAALQTRAVRDGDDYVINGQKIWTSGGHRANQMFCLVRTDPDAPKHRGISFLLIDDIKNTPGLTIRLGATSAHRQPQPVADLLQARHVLGMAVHANDSKMPLGGVRDRHENIGDGHIGYAGFEAFMAHPAVRDVPFLLEVPGLDNKGPLINMADRHHFNEVFFEDVRVPARNLIGEENRGWYVGMTLLDFERSGIGTTAGQRRTLEELAQSLKNGPADRRQKHRTKLADFVVANNVGKYLGYRIGWMQSKGTHPNYEASVIKIYQSELGQRIYNFGVNMLGLSGQLRPEEPRAPLGGGLPENYITSVPSTIYSGTNEIQRNIIATRGLGLPRD
jgi:alkylation response protein AidB-like acyl-CoA dehydrogenase